jgi:phospholipid-binding lipoprotein MlaA
MAEGVLKLKLYKFTRDDVLLKFSCSILLVFLVSMPMAQAQDAAWDESLLQNDVDPWEDFNRSVFGFNDWFDRAIFKPSAQVYDKVTPQFIKSGIGNFFDNIGELPTIGNDILQGQLGRAASATGRFVINTTLGLAGTVDVASEFGLEKHKEDFGQTLAVWGAPAGPYVVLPFLGPSTVRDTGALAGDWGTDLLSHIDNVETRNGLRALEILDLRASFLAADELMIGDRYVFLRDAYLQSRDYEISNGEVELDEFGFDDF